MHVNPVLVKEFCSQSKNITGYWWRISSITVIFFVWYINHADNPNNGQGALKAITFIAAIYFGLFAAIFTSHTIALELRNNTFGLLFLTRLRSSEILFGKILPNGIQCFICLIAIFPILSLPLINGGVTLTDVLRCWTFICFSIYYGLSIGIYWAVTRPMYDKLYDFLIKSPEGIIIFIVQPLLVPLLWFADPSDVIVHQIGNQSELFMHIATFFMYIFYIMMIYVCSLFMFSLSYKNFLSIWNREFKLKSFQDPISKWLLSKPLESNILKTANTEIIRSTKRRLLSIKDNKNPYQILIGLFHPNNVYSQSFIYFGLFSVIISSCLSLLFDTHPNRHANLIFPCLCLFIMEFAVRLNVAMETPRQMLYDRKSQMMELLLISPFSVLSIVAGYRSFLKHRLHHRFVLLGIGYVWVAGVFFAAYIRNGFFYFDRLILCLFLFLMTFFVIYIKFHPIPVRSTVKHYTFLILRYLSIPVSLSFIMINFIYIFFNAYVVSNTFHFFICLGFLTCSSLCFFRGLKTEYQRLQTKRFLSLIFIFILVFGIICYNMLYFFNSDKFGDITSFFFFFTGSILLFIWGFRYELQQSQIKHLLFPSAVYFLFFSGFFMIMYNPVFNYNLNAILLCLCFFVGTYFLSYYELYALQYYGIWTANGKHSFWFIAGKLFSVCISIPIVTFIAAFFVIQLCAVVFYDSFFSENRVIQLAGTFLLWHYFRSACSRFAINFAHRRLCQLRSLLD